MYLYDIAFMIYHIISITFIFVFFLWFKIYFATSTRHVLKRGNVIKSVFVVLIKCFWEKSFFKYLKCFLFIILILITDIQTIIVNICYWNFTKCPHLKYIVEGNVMRPVVLYIHILI